MICDYCEEPFDAGERAPNRGADLHRECLFRAVAGSVAHIQWRCRCYVTGSDENDPPGITLCQAARAAVRAYEEMEDAESDTDRARPHLRHLRN